MILNLKKNKLGFSLVEIIVALGVFSVIVLLSTGLFSSLFKMSSVMQSDRSLADARLTVLRALEDQDSFLLSIQHPNNAAAFACLFDPAVNGTGCSGVKNIEFQMFSYNPVTLATTRIPYVGLTSEPNAGFSALGTPGCAFDLATPSDTCPFRYVATWSAYCAPTNNLYGMASNEKYCHNPLIDVTVTFQFNPAQMSNFPPINSQKQSIRIMKSQSETDANKICLMTGGVFTPGPPPVCIPPSSPVSQRDCSGFCGAGIQPLVQGFGVNGVLHCSCQVVSGDISCNHPPFAPPAIPPYIPGPGAKGAVLLGIASDGTPHCGYGMIPQMIINGSINNIPTSGTPDGDGSGN